jgi:hypothetical protein
MGQMGLILLIAIAFVAIVLVLISNLNKPYYKLVRLTKKMSVDINNEKASEFISLLMSIKSMPNRPSYWDSIGRALKLVEQSADVDAEIKEKLRTLLLGLGIQRFQEVQKISTTKLV